MQIPIPYKSVEGKTYTLFDNNNSTSGYYRLISDLANQVLEKYNDPKTVLRFIRDYSKKKRTLRKLSFLKEDTGLISFVLHLLNESLSVYTGNVDTHLQNLPLTKYWDRRLSTTREQYHLYMLEIEITNRLCINQFLNADQKIALLPYCLRDFSANCKSKPDDFDYQCRYCSKFCYENYLSRLLKKYNIAAYVWKGSGLKQKAKTILKSNQTFAVLGIACVPELVFGMRKCLAYKIPAVGIPLNANCCIRWWGEFHKNSVDLEQLELLLTNQTQKLFDK
jgi:hypothetical protein